MNRRIDILRGLELEAYRMAYYLLEAEEPACEAAKRALLALHGAGELARATQEERRRLLKRLVMREAVSGFGQATARAN
ncbi:hypothetical protein SAMN05216312_108141 [Cohnella sp. OV330]|uniref:hypothetical protein n=1 Tax=Cohnella sp. OV330 TaxID=1855288 RepID=UPI0008E53909|nr:hypothetical protein [Cohnella sp. OV330]SFB44340.1 hypothetical protein SAMN05216312_108141 [Cohnella sp. OV330]